jgi:hypothetical protein
MAWVTLLAAVAWEDLACGRRALGGRMGQGVMAPVGPAIDSGVQDHQLRRSRDPGGTHIFYLFRSTPAPHPTPIT